MTDEATRKRVAAAAARYERKLGHKGASTGRTNTSIDVIPSGILALDYALGIGGWPRGHLCEVFGPPDIGKSSCIAFNLMREAQAMGLTPGIVALEPGYNDGWAEKNGIDPDNLLIGWPDNGQEAFDLAYDFVCDDDIDVVIFDSIGAILRPSEAEQDGKPSQGGQSALITWGVKRLLMPSWKRNKMVLLINQVRDKMDSRLPMLDSPGGHALKHSCAVRVQLKPGKDRYTTKVDGEDVQIGQSVVAVVLRNKMAEGSKQRAIFDNYFMEVDDQPFGVDKAADVLSVGVRTGVIRKAGGWYYHTNFPEGQLLGKQAVGEFLLDDKSTYATIRNEVLQKMTQKVSKSEDG
jgi:recombination protein RecA